MKSHVLAPAPHVDNVSWCGVVGLTVYVDGSGTRPDVQNAHFAALREEVGVQLSGAFQWKRLRGGDRRADNGAVGIPVVQNDVSGRKEIFDQKVSSEGISIEMLGLFGWRRIPHTAIGQLTV